METKFREKFLERLRGGLTDLEARIEELGGQLFDLEAGIAEIKGMEKSFDVLRESLEDVYCEADAMAVDLGEMEWEHSREEREAKKARAQTLRVEAEAL